MSIDREKWSFDDLAETGKQWDLITCVASIHHSNDLDTDLVSLYESLSPGGHLILANEIMFSDGLQTKNV